MIRKLATQWRRIGLALRFVAAISIGTLTTSAIAQGVGGQDARRSVFGVTPSLGVGLGFLTTDAAGSVVAVNGSGSTIRPPDTGQTSAITPLAHLSLGLETSALEFLPGAPSVFAQADYFPSLGLTRNIASEGSGQGFSPPDAENFPEGAIAGQGSKTMVEADVSTFGLSAGLSFPIEILGVALRVKPGVSWIHYTWDVQGRVLRAVKPSTSGTDFRGVDLSARDSFDAHGVGPYFGVEFEASPFGPLLASIYIEAAAYRVLSDQSESLNARESFDDQFGVETYEADWGAEFDDWTYRSTVGVRIYLKQR